MTCASFPEVLTINDTVTAGLSFYSMGRSTFALVLFILTIIYCLTCLGLFWYHKPYYARMRLRFLYYNIVYMLAIFAYGSGQLLPLVIGIANYPCVLEFTLVIISAAFFNITNFTRNTCFLFLTRIGRATFLYGRVPVELTAQEEDRKRSRPFAAQIAEDLSLIMYALKFIVLPESRFENMTQEDHMLALRTLKVLISTRGLVMLSMFVSLPWTIICLTTVLSLPYYRNNCYGCSPTPLVPSYVILVSSFYLVSIAVFFVIKCRHMPDNWGMFREGRFSSVGIVIGFVGILLLGFGPETFGPFSYNLIITFGFCLGFSSGTLHQVYLARKEEKLTEEVKYRREHGIESMQTSLTESTLLKSPLGDLKGLSRLNKILSNSLLAKAFELHLSHEFASENMLFIKDVSNWKEQYAQRTKEFRNSSFRQIVNTYVSDRGLYQINLPAELSRPLLEIANDLGDIEIALTVLDDARYEIAKLMEVGPVPRFMQTDEYKNLMSGQVAIKAF